MLLPSWSQSRDLLSLNGPSLASTFKIFLFTILATYKSAFNVWSPWHLWLEPAMIINGCSHPIFVSLPQQKGYPRAPHFGFFWFPIRWGHRLIRDPFCFLLWLPLCPTAHIKTPLGFNAHKIHGISKLKDRWENIEENKAPVLIPPAA